MYSDKTCGQLFTETIDLVTSTEGARWGFKIGFLAGLAEKVYLGACPAACIRPTTEQLKVVTHAAKQIATIYDLALATFSVGDEYGIEIWLFRTQREMTRGIRQMAEADVNSPLWHILRANLCGISQSDVDLNFHERPGYDKRTT